MTDKDKLDPRPGPDGQIAVEAWVRTSVDRTEAMQPLVSQWRPAETPVFSAYDATRTGGLLTAGHYGAVFDGRHVYYCPIRPFRRRDSVHGHVLRCDTHADFHDPAAWEAFDAGSTDGLTTVSYYGASFDGRHVIFTPREDLHGYHSRVLRFEAGRPFGDPASWSAHDAGLPVSGQGAATDGRYVYFPPGYESVPGRPFDESVPSGRVLRLDTHGEFRDPGSYQVFDTSRLSPQAVCFDGGAFDGRYIYLVPLIHGVVARHDTRGRFDDPAAWEVHDARPHGLGMNVGAVFDGRWLYFCSYGHSRMVRYDTTRPFADGNAWESWEAGGTDGLDTGGFDGGFFDGRYVYYCPWTRQAAPGEIPFHCNFLRYDTTRPFAAAASWSAYDASRTDGLHTVGYNAGAFDGRHFYGAPLFDGRGEAYHGRALRCDTLGRGGAFSLRYGDYGHNGGLCAAVPGPSFLINTEQGVRSVAAYRRLEPGAHHLAGIYDGRSLSLYVDGELAARRAASGRLVECDAEVTVGSLSGGSARFEGTVERARITPAAVTP